MKIRTEVGTLECDLSDANAVDYMGEQLKQACAEAASRYALTGAAKLAKERGMHPRLVITVATEWDK